MSVLNEKKINNEIKERWKKDEYKRMIVDSEKVSDEFRVICSSRSSIIKIIEDINKNGLTVEIFVKLRPSHFVSNHEFAQPLLTFKVIYGIIHMEVFICGLNYPPRKIRIFSDYMTCSRS